MSSVSHFTPDEPALSAHTYDQLLAAGIVVDEAPWSSASAPVKELVGTLLDFTETVPSDCRLTLHYQGLGMHHRIADFMSDRTLVDKIYHDQGQLDDAILKMRMTHEPTWNGPICVALACFLGDRVGLSNLKDIVWASSAHSANSAVYLDQPKPSITVGFRSSESVKTIAKPRGRKTPDNALRLLNTDPLDRSRVRNLSVRAGPGFMPYVNEGHPELIYPFFCFQAEQHTVSKDVAVDRLARSLSFAIGLLKRLRDRAGQSRDLPIITFGTTSVGKLWTLYVAYEAEPFYYGVTCEICTLWSGAIDGENDEEGVEFLWLMERIKRWAKEILRPQIQTWLIALERLSRQ